METGHKVRCLKLKAPGGVSGTSRYVSNPCVKRIKRMGCRRRD